MTSLSNLYKYAKTGVASKDMTSFDKLLAMQLAGDEFPVESLTGVPPISFQSDGTPLISLLMKGNTQQTGTPSPDNIIMPTFCGELVGANWTIPITCAGQTVPVYLGQVSTVRKIKKLVLDGTETIGSYQGLFYIQLPSDAKSESNAPVCTHFLGSKETSLDNYCIRQMATGYWGGRLPALQLKDSSHGTETALKNFFAAQYANGTPVTLRYVLATPEITILNEPLAKIGDYCDELHSSDAGVTIPTSKGSNTLTVDTPLQPNEMTITFKG